MDDKIDIRMIMPCVDKKRPIAPLNYLQWLFNSKGFNGKLIRFLDHDTSIKYQEFDAFVYISSITSHDRVDNFLKYDIENDIIYIWRDSGTKIITEISELVSFCEEKDIKILVEKVGECTYGADSN